MTTDPNISPELPQPDIEEVEPGEPPLSEDELPSKEDIEESEEVPR